MPCVGQCRRQIAAALGAYKRKAATAAGCSLQKLGQNMHPHLKEEHFVNHLGPCMDTSNSRCVRASDGHGQASPHDVSLLLAMLRKQLTFLYLSD